MTITRRNLMIGAAGLAAGSALGGLGGRALAQGLPSYTPEAGASLRLLRWVPFVPSEEEAWNANTRAFTEATGVEVRIDQESWEDVRPKAAVAANVGSGPDMVMSWFDDPFQYPDKLVDVTELATALGSSQGGWYAGLEGYARKDDTFIALPLCAIGNAICYRKSHVDAAGFSAFPKDTAGFLELCKALKANNTPAGFRMARRWATATTMPTGCSGATAASSSTRAVLSPSTVPRPGPRSTMPSSSTRPSSPAPRAGSTSTTTAPSSPARSR